MITLEICPLCGAKMEKGYIVTVYDWKARSPIEWRTLVKNPRRIKSFWDRFKYSYASPTLNDLEAYRCINCKIAIIYYGEAEK